jgi:hypothetical protein
MERIDVASTNVKSVGYDAMKAVLEIEFVVTDGAPPAVYEYREITPTGELKEIFAALHDPDMSAGRVVHHRLKRNPMIIDSKIEDVAA